MVAPIENADEDRLRIACTRRAIQRHLARAEVLATVRIGDFARWTERWHAPARLAKARTITAVLSRGEFPPPAIIGAGASLPAGVERIATAAAQRQIGAQEGHRGYTVSHSGGLLDDKIQSGN